MRLARLGESNRVAIRRDDSRSRGDESVDQRSADAAGGAGDDDHADR